MKRAPIDKFAAFLSIFAIATIICLVIVTWQITVHQQPEPEIEICSDPSVLQWIEVSGHPNVRAFPNSTIRSLPGTDDFQLMAPNINGMRLSPNGRYLAIRGDVSLSMHDAESFEMLWEQPTEPEYIISNFLFSPDGSFIATSTRRYESQDMLASLITLWDSETGEMLHEFDARNSDISWSVDGEYIALNTKQGSHYQSTLYNTHTGKSAFVFDVDSPNNAWSPDGTKLAFGVSGGTVEIHNVADGRLAQTLPIPDSKRRKAQPGRVGLLDWSPNGKYIGGSVSFSYEPIVDTRFWAEGPPYVDVLVIWDAATGQIVFSEEGDEFVEWSPTGSRFISSNWDTQSVWSLDPIQRLCSYKTYEDGTHKFISTQWTEDDVLLAYDQSSPRDDSTTVFFIDAETLVTVEQRNLGRINGLAWSPDGVKLAAIVDDTALLENAVVIWDMVTGNQESELENAAGLLDGILEWSPDGTMLVTTVSEGEVNNDHMDIDWQSTAYLWDVETQRQLLEIEDLLHGDIRWSPTEDLLAGISPDGDIVLWDVEAESVLDTIQCNCRILAWSPDGKKLAATTDEGTTHICDIEAGKYTQNIPLSGYHVTWSPDGKRLAVGSGADEDGTVHLWDLEQQEYIAQFSGPKGSSAVTDMEWSSDGQLLAVTFYYNNRVFLLETGTGELLHTFEEQVGSIVSLDWSPDGETLASGSDRGELLLIDMSEWIE